MTKRRISLDTRDLDIVNALDRLGPKTSTKQLGSIVDIPSRTVRYRLTRLRSAGFLQPLHVLTHERKLGLGENILVFEKRPRKGADLDELLEVIPYFYWCAPSYGRFNGYLIHSVFALDSPETNLQILKTMQRSGLILDYYSFEVVDYNVKNIDLAYFSPKHGWTWDWNKWAKNIEDGRHGANEWLFSLEKAPASIDFDFRDILILKHLLKNARVTVKQIGNALNLSEAQVSKRIRDLREGGIIKGYKSVFNPAPDEDFLSIYLFVEVEQHADKVLSYFHQLPYSIDVHVESRNKFCVRLGLSAGDFNGFLKGFNLLRHDLTRYFFQIVHHPVTPRVEQVYDMFMKKSNRWEMPIEEYIDKIESFASIDQKEGKGTSRG